MAAATGTRKLVWVGLPVVRRENLEPKLATLDQSGSYDAYLTTPDGTPTLVRAADGVHFSLSGYDMLAHAVLDRIGALTQTA
jgi:hypothetical protein